MSQQENALHVILITCEGHVAIQFQLSHKVLADTAFRPIANHYEAGRNVLAYLGQDAYTNREPA